MDSGFQDPTFLFQIGKDPGFSGKKLASPHLKDRDPGDSFCFRQVIGPVMN